MTTESAALGFLAPMPSELKPLRRALALRASGKGLDAVHTGALDGRPVVALLTGIGTARAAARARHLLAAPRGRSRHRDRGGRRAGDRRVGR